MLPDESAIKENNYEEGLNAPTGAWCSLTWTSRPRKTQPPVSQCTYRCVVLPDAQAALREALGLQSQCTYRCVVLPD